VRNESGTALLEMVVLGFAIVALALPLFLAVGVLSDARVRADVAASDAALWIARHGGMPPEDWADVEVAIVRTADVVTVRASIAVQMLGVEFTTVTASVDVSRSAWVSPYRSGR